MSYYNEISDKLTKQPTEAFREGSSSDAREDNDKPITAADLRNIGFQQLANGQYELDRENHIYLGYFKAKHHLVLKRIMKDAPLNRQFGYHASLVDGEIRTVGQLRRYL